jgi:hypothetical protein
VYKVYFIFSIKAVSIYYAKINLVGLLYVQGHVFPKVA